MSGMELSNSAGYLPSTYGDMFADIYDAWYQEVTDVEGTVRLISELAADGRVLELGVGTGRLAIPLAETGVDISGIDSSSEMLKRLSERDSGQLVEAHLADMAEWQPEGPFKVVFCAYNTFFNLVETNHQRNCLSLSKNRLDEDGLFVLEAFVPQTSLDSPNRGVESRSLSNTTVLSVTIHERKSGIVRGQSIELGQNKTILRPWRILIKTPQEIDLLARKCGLRLVTRWQDWDRTPFSEGSNHHISVYAPLKL